MDSDFPSFTDGLIHEKEISVWPELEFPFRENVLAPDLYTRVFTRTVGIDPLRYAPKPAPKRLYYQRLTYSNALTNAAWTQTGVVATAATERNPWNGDQTVDELAEDTSTGAHSIGRAATFSTVPVIGIRQRYWFSAIVAIDPGSAPRYLLLRATDASGDYYQAFFNPWSGEMINTLATGAGAANTIARVMKLPRGPNPSIAGAAQQFYWIALRFTPSAGAGSVGLYLTQDTSTTSYTGTGVRPVYVAQMQLGGGSLLTNELGPLILSSGTAPLTVTAPEIDAIDDARAAALGADPFAFHAAESPLRYESRRRGLVIRTYARIPRQQIVPDTRFFTRPSLDGAKSGSAYAVGFVPGRDHIFTTARKSVTRVASTAASTIAAAMPSSNIVFTDSGGHVVNLAANSSAAAATSALAAGLTSLTGISCASGVGWLNIVWTGTMTSIVPPSGVYVAGIGGFHVELASSGTVTTPATTVFTTSAAHGAVLGDRVAMWAGDALVGKGIVVAVIDSTSFTVMTSDLNSADSQITHVAFSSDADLCVLNGPRTCSIQRISDFFLPGYSAGISTAADIPAQDPATDPENWLAAIIAGTTWVNIDGSEIRPYQGPILERQYAQVQLADAVQTVTA